MYIDHSSVHVEVVLHVETSEGGWRGPPRAGAAGRWRARAAIAGTTMGGAQCGSGG